MNCEYIKITNKDGVVTLEDLQNGLVLDIQQGDKIFIGEYTDQLKFEIIDDVNLKLIFPDGTVVLLNNVIEHLDANINIDEGNIFESLLTKLEFLNKGSDTNDIDLNNINNSQLDLLSVNTYADLIELMQETAAGNTVEERVEFTPEEETTDTSNRRGETDNTDFTNQRSEFLETLFETEDDEEIPTTDNNETLTVIDDANDTASSSAAIASARLAAATTAITTTQTSQAEADAQESKTADAITSAQNSKDSIDTSIASGDAEAVNSAIDDAKEDTQTAVTEATNYQNEAQEAVDAAQEAVNAAQEAVDAAEKAVEDAQTAYDLAVEAGVDTTDEEEALNNAQNTLDEANDVKEEADAAKETADEELETANEQVQTANELNDEVNALNYWATVEVTPVDTITEDSVTAGSVVATTTTEDRDGDDVTLSISNTTYYELNDNGEVVLTQAGADLVNGGADLPDFVVYATDGKQESATAEDVNPADTTLVDDETVLTLNATSATEDVTQAGATVATFSVSDEDETATVDFTAGTNSEGYYAIDGNNIVLTAEGEAFLDAGGTLPEISLTTDGTSTDKTATATPTTILVNDDPTAVAETVNVNEDAIITGSITATDEENDSLTFSVTSGNDIPEGLTLNSDGTYTFDASSYDSLDDNENQVIEVPITITDANGGSTETTLTIDVSGQNNDLTYVSEAAGYSNVVGYYELDENGNPTGEIHVVIDNQNGMAGGTQLADLDPNTEYGFFIIANGTSSIDDDSTVTFEMVDGQPVLKVDGNDISQPVYHDNPTFNADGKDHFIFESDGNGGTNIKIEDLDGLGDADFDDVVLNTNFEINVNEVTTLEITAGSATEDSTVAGDTVATFSASDADDTITVNFTNGTNDNGYYAIQGNAVILTAAGEAFLDAGGTLPEISLTTNTGVTDTATPTTNLVDDVTVLEITAGSATEDSTVAGEAIATFSVSDEDSVVTVDFTAGTNDDGYYAISGNSIVLTQAGEAFLDAGGTLPEISLTTNTGVTDTATPTTIIELDKPIITNVTDTNGDLSEVIMQGTGDNPGNTITLYDEDGNAVGTTTVQNDGSWSIEISDLQNTPLNDNEFFSVKESDSNGNISDSSETVHVWQGNWSDAQTDDFDDYVMMGSDNDTINVNDNDSNDSVVIDGGDGTDTATFSGNYEDYIVTINSDGHVIVTESISTDSDADGTGDINELRNIESIVFADGTYDVISGTFNGIDDEAQAPIVDISIGTVNIVTTGTAGQDLSDANDVGNYNGKIHKTTAYGSSNDDMAGLDRIQNSYVSTFSGDDTIKVDNKIENSTMYTGSDDDKVLVDGDITNTYLNMGSGNDELLVTDELRDSTIYMGSGNDIVNLDDFDDSYINMGSDNDVVVLSGSQSEYTITDNGNGNYTITNSDNKTLTLESTETIIFNGDGTYIGNTALAESILGTETTTYEYPVDVTATLVDTDGSETLSAITISNLPVGVTVKAADNVTDNGDGTYSVSVTSGVAASITLVSSYDLSNTQLNDIQASATSTETSSGDTATTVATDDLTEIAGFDIDISDVDSTVVNGDDFDVTGGAGDDEFSLDSGDFTFETANGGSGSGSGSSGAGRSASNVENDVLDGNIDGGDGYDTLIFEDDIDFDFNQLSEDVKNIEAINLKNEQANSLGDISAADVLKMTDEDNVLKIIGDDADEIGLRQDEGWSKSDQKVTEDGETFDVWTNDEVTVFVDESITVDI